MGLESVTNIDDLVVTNPIKTDLRSKGDDHLRNIKIALATLLENVPGVKDGTPGELTIATGAIVPTAAMHYVDTQGDAASDDLDTITATNMYTGGFLWLRAQHTDRTVILRHQTGNITSLKGDITLDNTDKWVLLWYDGTDYHVMHTVNSKVFDTQYTEVGNVGADEDDLMSFTIPVNVFDKDGKVIRITASGKFAHTGVKQLSLKLHFGATSIELYNVNTGDAGDWWVEVIIIRTGSNTQQFKTLFYRDNLSNDTLTQAGIVVEDTAATETDSGTIIVKFTGEHVGGSTNDLVTQALMIVEELN